MVYDIALFHLCTFCKVAKAMKNTVRLLCLVTLCRHGTFIGRSVSFQGLKALCGCRFTHTLQHSLAKLCLVTVCIIAVLGDHSVCFSGTLCSNTRMYAAVQRSKAPQGAHPASSGLAGGGSGWRGAFVYAQYCPEHFPTTNTMQPRHCVGRGGPLATLGIMQGAAGDREGGGQGSVEGGTPG